MTCKDWKYFAIYAVGYLVGCGWVLLMQVNARPMFKLLLCWRDSACVRACRLLN